MWRTSATDGSAPHVLMYWPTSVTNEWDRRLSATCVDVLADQCDERVEPTAQRQIWWCIGVTMWRTSGTDGLAPHVLMYWQTSVTNEWHRRLSATYVNVLADECDERVAPTTQRHICWCIESEWPSKLNGVDCVRNNSGQQ